MGYWGCPWKGWGDGGIPSSGGGQRGDLAVGSRAWALLWMAAAAWPLLAGQRGAGSRKATHVTRVHRPQGAQHLCRGRGRCCGPREGGCSHHWLCREPGRFGHLSGIFWGWTRVETRSRSLLEAGRVVPMGSVSPETCTPVLILPGETPRARVGFALGSRLPALRPGGGCASGPWLNTFSRHLASAGGM